MDFAIKCCILLLLVAACFSQANADSETEDSKSLSAGVIAGIVVGVFMAIGCCFLCICCCCFVGAAPVSSG